MGLAVFAADLTIPANAEVEVTDSAAITYGGVTADRFSLVQLGDGAKITVKAIDATYGLPQHFVVNGNVTFDFSACSSTPWFAGSVVTNAANAVVNVKLPGNELRLGTWRNYSCGVQFGNQTKYSLASGSYGVFWQFSTGAFKFETDVRPQLTITKAAGFWTNPEDWVNADGQTKTFGSVVYSDKPCVSMLGPGFFGTATRTVEISDHHLGSMHRQSVGTNVTIKVNKDAVFFYQTNEYKMNGGNPFASCSTTYDIHYANVDLNGGMIFDRSWGDRLEGKFTGTGSYKNTGWGASNAITTKSVFDAEIDYQGEQFGDHLAICAPVLGKPIKSVTTASGLGAANPCSKFAKSRYKFSETANTGDRYASNGLYFRPSTVETEPTLLPIGTWKGNSLSPTNGPSLKVFARQLVTIGTLTANAASGGVHVYGPDDFSKGLGSVVVGTWKTLGKMYLATNVNFTVSNFNAAATILVDTYKSENRARFTFLNSDANGQKAVFKAVSPKQLPCVIEGFPGTLEVGPQMVGAEGEGNNDVFSKSETDWYFPIDTTAATPLEADPYGCGGSGALDLKYASGTITVDLLGDAVLKPGKYPLLTCTSGGEVLNETNWPVVIKRNGVETTAADEGLVVKRGSTGVYLFVPKGLHIFIR